MILFDSVSWGYPDKIEVEISVYSKDVKTDTDMREYIAFQILKGQFNITKDDLKNAFPESFI